MSALDRIITEIRGAAADMRECCDRLDFNERMEWNRRELAAARAENRPPRLRQEIAPPQVYGDEDQDGNYVRGMSKDERAADDAGVSLWGPL